MTFAFDKLDVALLFMQIVLVGLFLGVPVLVVVSAVRWMRRLRLEPAHVNHQGRMAGAQRRLDLVPARRSLSLGVVRVAGGRAPAGDRSG